MCHIYILMMLFNMASDIGFGLLLRGTKKIVFDSAFALLVFYFGRSTCASIA